MNWLEKADFAIKFAVFPGGLIIAGIVFLVNGCVEYYADILPPKYRARKSAEPDWRSVYGTERMHVVKSVLQQFVLSHGFRETDVFQFRPGDRIGDLLGDFYPSRLVTEDPAQQSGSADSAGNTDVTAQLSLREYVDARIGANCRRPDSPGEAALEREPGTSAIDRPSRDHLVSAINRYMDESIMAFAFDHEINLIRSATKDTTVQFVVDSLWFQYDDCKDHLAGLSKEQWDYFQRLILLLESDAQIERVSRRKWSVRQVVAGLALLGFGRCIAWLGFGWHLFGVAVLFGPISILLSAWRNNSDAQRNREQLSFFPFASFAELRTVRKTASGFAKRRYPPGAKIRNIRSRLMMTAVRMQTLVLWSFLSPLVLLFQALPEKEASTRIRESIRGRDGRCTS